jgi:peroxiredoxin
MGGLRPECFLESAVGRLVSALFLVQNPPQFGKCVHRRLHEGRRARTFMKHLIGFSLALLILISLACSSAVPAADRSEAASSARVVRPAQEGEVPNFALLDYHGKYHELHRTQARAVVLFFTGNGCPIARQSIPKLRALRRKFADQGVVVWMVNSYSQDDREAIRKEAKEFPAGSVPVLMDPRQGLALSFGVRRTAEAIAIDTTDWSVFYRGAIDDQLSEGAGKPEATEKFLENALRQHLAGEPVLKAKTSVKGCLIAFEKISSEPEGQVSYAKQVAPILQAKCVGCHSAGNIGPFAYSSYAVAKKKARMMEEVILAQRMPPWHADPAFGQFQHTRSLDTLETQTLLSWVSQGAPGGEGDDPLAAVVPPAPVAWPLGQPDFVARFPHAEEIPATGVLEYRHIRVAAPNTDDAWLGAIMIRPGCRQVVHHVVVRAKVRGTSDDGSGRGTLLAVWVPGAVPVRFPDNTGRFLPKGAQLDIEMHYTPDGAARTDETEIGFYRLPARPKMSLNTIAAVNMDLNILPGDPDSQTHALVAIKRDCTLYSLSPHQHKRGSWMKFEALQPDGTRQTLLSVPHYDFNWQTEYQLAEPKHLAAGTWILCTGGFDNSALNPSNPNPAKRVKWGDQSFEEMFVGFMNVAEAPDAGLAKGDGAGPEE